MNRLKRYYWYVKSQLRTIALYFLGYLLVSGVILALLDAIGGGDAVKSLATVVLFLGFLAWTGRELRASEVPGELDVMAKRDDSPDATTIVELLEGNPSVDRGTARTLVDSLFDATRNPGRRSRFWSGLDCGDGEVYERLFGLYSQHRNKQLLLVVERLARDAPLEARAYEETLLAELDPDRETEAVTLDDWRPRHQYFWTIPSLVLAHISRELPGSAERYAPRVAEMLDPRGDELELWGVLALGELAAHDESAKEAIRDLRDSRVSALRNAAGEILSHYEESDRPYPAGRRLDEFDAEHEEKYQKWRKEANRARADAGSDDWWEDEW
ncbi:hypothetical protein SAMN04488066_12428 [Halorubrum aquaticum]|uniref:Uncharacterized protein n=1 Tax=Halorubrum aquaticum TaxID=387340 RepID=A0A1I3CL69_9EURY|nr:hypothetical protein [Halorubrum aquaticum]SFH75232.1 hypothetical protein SAMN04488066_12428 [Halorubrum aquaticum]